MRIISIESQIVALPYDMGGPHGYFAGRLWDRMEIVLVRVETEDGLVGWGEAFGHASTPATRTAIDTIVAPLAVGRDADDIEGLTRSVMHGIHLLGRNGPFVYAFSGVEIALWDILGKRQGKPLHALLGDRNHAELDAYASLLAYRNPELVAKNATAACAKGHRFLKLHETTRENILAARHAPGVGDTPIMVDVNCVWSVEDAHRMAASLAGDNLMWLEEPVWPPEDVHGLAEIRRHGIPISAGENVQGFFGFQALIDAKAIDIAQPSVTKIGGIGTMCRIVDLCQSRGVQVTPHSAYYGPGFLATIHVIAGRIEKPMIETLWLDMEANPFDPWVRPKNGRIQVPQGPGLGCDPDPAVLARYRRGDVVTTTAK